MRKRIPDLTTAELKEEMSIAGSPDKIMSIHNALMKDIGEKIDKTNAAELLNMEFSLKRVQAEIRLYLRWLEKETGQKYKL